MSAEAETETGVVPLQSEEIAVSRRRLAGDTVRVDVVTREREQLIDEDLTHARVEIERVAIGRPVAAVPPVREEGDTTIMSVVEETIVVERRLILKEEVHIRRIRVKEHHRETVTVHQQDAVTTRVEAGAAAVQEGRASLGKNPTKPPIGAVE